MKYGNEQVAFQARETVEKMLAALQRDQLVSGFVDGYVARYDRTGLKASRLRYRELLTTLTRESLLAMAAAMLAALPRYLAGRKTSILRGASALAVDRFRLEFLESLAREREWTAADAEEFRRDLELYAHIAARQPWPVKPRKPDERVSGPFVDRCALLLDPSLLEKAQQAAGEFQAELERATQKILAAVFSRRRKD